MTWTTPGEIEQQLARYWASGQILTAWLLGTTLFPLRLRLKRPNSAALAEQFNETRQWIASLQHGSKAERGFGYEISWSEIRHRRLGQNRVPAGVLVPSEADALRLLGKSVEAEQFRALADATLARVPTLKDWLIRSPFSVLQHASDWPRILDVVCWFAAHPNSGLYLRQLDVPGVDSKFIELRKPLLSELLDSAAAREPEAGAIEGKANFEKRHGLLPKPALIRFRILDRRLYIQGWSDLTIPVAQFAEWVAPPKRVFITENEINGLAFPDVADSVILFGMGYGVQILSEASWLRDKDVQYWGDIDTHGFAILDRLRGLFPQTQSFLMDRDTLLNHRELWGVEGEPFRRELQRLTGPEQTLFRDLQENRYGYRIRLEQERISFAYLLKQLSSYR